MCVESQNRFPTLQTLYTSAFWTICGEWGAQRSFDMTGTGPCHKLHQTTNLWQLHVSGMPVFTCLFLHQTTTPQVPFYSEDRCLPVYSYIKPQPGPRAFPRGPWCLPVYSYIKPQLDAMTKNERFGVYLSIPTSNHNSLWHNKKW